MNISDVKVAGLFEKAAAQYEMTDPISIIFARQRELIESYVAIEASIKGKDAPHTWDLPVSLHSFEGQAALKERAWWFTEEIGEALDALVSQGTESLKFGEEVGDALHFLTELCLMADISAIDLHNAFWEEPFDWRGFWPGLYSVNQGWDPRLELITLAAKIITDLAMGMWQLRNKSWKQTQVFTDVPRFRRHVIDAYHDTLVFAQLSHRGGLRGACELYLRKSEVNLFRIRSRY